MSTNSSARPDLVQVRGLVDLFTSTLERRGYRPTAIHAYRGALEHFMAWAAPNADCAEIGEASIPRFVDEQLLRCDCPGRHQRGKATTLSALRHLPAILRGAGLLPPVPPNFPHFVNSELEAYSDYAAEVGGRAPATPISRRQYLSSLAARPARQSP